MFQKSIAAVLFALAAAVVVAVTDVDVTRIGRARTTVAIDVANPDFAKSLRKNLELSGLFEVRRDGAVKVTGTAGAAVTAAGAGRSVTTTEPVSDALSARMAARRFADRMCEQWSQGRQKGFATDRIVFVSRKSATQSEICACYPDGYDIVQLTHDGAAVVGPRWKDRDTIFYTNLKNGPQVWELDSKTGRRNLRWSFKGLTTGATVSPDGRKVAAIMSFQGNPELYVIDIAAGSWTRLTKTKNASEGQPAWSPDGKSIVYVSDETRHPQLYIIDVATKARRRLTTKGSQNVDPDWGRDGRITYITKRGGGAQVAVIEPAEGEASVQLVTDPGNWEHPSWSRDCRNVVASRDNALFVVDTATVDGAANPPRQVFKADGKWITPSWSK